MARGDRGINPLDEGCKIHDIAYSNYKDTGRRQQADKELSERAWQRFKSAGASLGVKAADWAVTTAIKTEAKFGGGSRKRRRCVNVEKPLKAKDPYLRPYPKRGAGKKEEDND